MTTEEELEQRVNNLLDDKQKELEAARAAIQKEKPNEILKKAVTGIDNHIPRVREA